MNLDSMNKIQRQGGRFWNVSTVAELFDSPLPTDDPNGNDIEDWQDLFRTSVLGEIFVPESDEVFFSYSNSEEKNVVSPLEFVAWQIDNASAEFIYYLINIYIFYFSHLSYFYIISHRFIHLFRIGVF